MEFKRRSNNFKRSDRNKDSRREEGPARERSNLKRDDKPPFRKKDSRFSGARGKGPTGSKHNPDFYGKKKTFSKRKPEEVESLANAEGLIRLNKYISNSGICSRREADEFIKAGLVSVNGKVLTEMGVKVKPGDVVRYHDSVVQPEKMVYVLLNKPKDYITTADDPFERKTVMELVRPACRERIYPVGRLDRNTTGLLLFTNDGDLAKKLMHPSTEITKLYHVELDRQLKPEDMSAIRKGIELEDGFIKVDDIAYTQTPEMKGKTDKSQIGIELHSGRNRIVRKIFEHLTYKVKKLDRTLYAGLTKKDLPRGKWRHLTPLEVSSLKMITGKKKYQKSF
jgi:23S rRNA pseudouridine2605 synthase